MEHHLLLDLGPPLAVGAIGNRLYLAAAEVAVQAVSLFGADHRQVGDLAQPLLTDHRRADAGAVVELNGHRESRTVWCG